MNLCLYIYDVSRSMRDSQTHIIMVVLTVVRIDPEYFITSINQKLMKPVTQSFPISSTKIRTLEEFIPIFSFNKCFSFTNYCIKFGIRVDFMPFS